MIEVRLRGIMNNNRLYDVLSDGVNFCTLICDSLSYDAKTYRPQMAIMLYVEKTNYTVTSKVLLGEFGMSYSDFDELRFIKENLNKLKHPAFEHISRELKLSHILT